MKKKQIILLIICFALIGLTVTLNYLTINQAKERVIKEQEIKDNEKETSTTNIIIEEMPIEGEEGVVAGASTKEESNQYNTKELAIIISSTIILTLTILYMVTTKLCRYSINTQINSTERLIYYCSFLVIVCSIIPASLVIATDKKILNGYDTKSIADKSMAIIEVDQDKKVSNLHEVSDEENKSVIQVSNMATYEADNIELNKNNGHSTDYESSELYGLNAAFIAKEGSSIILSNSKLNSVVAYSAAFFATGNGTNASLNNVELTTTKDNSNGLNASDSAEISAQNLTITTKGQYSNNIKTLDTNSLISITDSSLKAQGQNSSLMYSKGKIEATDITGETNSTIAVIEDRNSLALTTSTLKTNGSFDNPKEEYNAAFLIYSQESQNSSSTYSSAKLDIVDSVIEITKDSPWYEKTPIFYLTNTEANINITNTELNYGSNILLKAVSSTEYGDVGDNGADVTFTATDQELTGDIIVDSNSKVRLNLNNSTYEGQINADNLSANVDVTFDYDSRWNLTGDSYINTLQITKTDYLRRNVRKYIRSNGYNVYYNSANNEWLEGRTYNLVGGGKLIPLES